MKRLFGIIKQPQHLSRGRGTLALILSFASLFVANYLLQQQNFGNSGGGITSVAVLPATCTPGVTAPVQLSVAPFGIFYCSATNIWSSTADVLKGITCVGCKADAEAVNDATVTNASANVTTGGGDIAFTSADTAKACYATSGGGPGVGHVGGKLSMAQGTFTFTSAHAGSCTTANANATGAANNYFFWGTDDATALTAWWTAMNPSGALCKSGILPGTPFMTSTNFGSAASSVCKTPITGSGNEGINVTGFGQLTSLMIVLPSFDPTTCTGGVGSNICFMASVGDSMYQFGIWGGERSDCPSTFNNKGLLTINTDTHIVNVEGLGWCASSTSTAIGLIAAGGSAAQQAGIILDGFGSIALQAGANGVPIVNSWFGDSTSDVSIVGTTTWSSTNNTFGDVANTSTMVLVGAGATFQSVDDTCFDASAGIMVGVKVNGAAAVANITNMKCDVSGNTGGIAVWLAGAGARANVLSSVLKGGSATEDVLVDNATGVFNDIAGNSFVQNRINVVNPCNWWVLNTIACVGLTAQTNNIGATTLITSPTQAGASQGPQLYTAYYHINVTTAGTSGSITVNLICPNGTATFTQPGAQTVSVTATAGTETSGIISCHAASASAIQYSVTGIVTPGTLAYTLDVKLRPT